VIPALATLAVAVGTAIGFAKGKNQGTEARDREVAAAAAAAATADTWTTEQVVAAALVAASVGVMLGRR